MKVEVKKRKPSSSTINEAHTRSTSSYRKDERSFFFKKKSFIYLSVMMSLHRIETSSYHTLIADWRLHAVN